MNMYICDILRSAACASSPPQFIYGQVIKQSLVCNPPTRMLQPSNTKPAEKTNYPSPTQDDEYTPKT
jgi:hypothetical protein